MPNKLYFDKENPNEVSDFKFYERLMFLEIGIWMVEKLKDFT